MITIKFEGMKEVQKMLADAGRQAPFAMTLALNDLAFMVRAEEVNTIASVFTRPKPQTVRNVKVRKATKQNLTTTIAFNQIYEGDEYMIPEIEGGPRKMKRSEKAFGRFYVPGPGAQLDQYGNIKGSQMTQIMSRFGRISERGFMMNQTARSKSRLTGSKKTTEYFLVTKKTGGLVPGVYQRVQSGVGFGAKTSRSLPVGSYQKGRSSGKFASVVRSRGVIPVLIFVNRAPRYNKRFPFYAVGQRIVDANAHALLAKAIDRAMSTAR